jgi:hypothetical protein
MSNLILITLTLLLGLSVCQEEKVEDRIKNDPKFAEELRQSPESITIANNKLILSTYLWRDFMPISEENGSNMICINKVTEVDKIPILPNIILKKQYVILGNEIWTADYLEIRKISDFIIEGIVRDGPKWGPSIEVDVVCEFDYDGTAYRILSKSQLIGRTE